MMMKRLSFIGTVLVLSIVGLGQPLMAQSVTAGDIQGVVTDTTGAVIPNAQVTVKNLGSGEVKTTASSGSGSYHVALLAPGTYTVTVMLAGFGTSSSNVTVGAGNVTTDDVRLSVGNAGTVVEVTAAAALVNTENGNVETVFSAETVQALPNPGNDLTFIAQTAPGSVMNTGTAAGGYGNFSSFGISGLSNMFTLDGGYENDPFLNLNNTGASNLTLGNNEVDTVTVVSPAFSAQFGGLGGAQVNEITTAGQNRVHGNLNYYWSGRVLNSNDWFNKQAEAFNGTQNIPSFVNANQWGAAIGGPIYRNKLFFFVNTEGLRVTTPVSGQVYAPSPAFEACSLTGAGCNGSGVAPGDSLNVAAIQNCEVTNPNNSTCVGDPNFSYGSFSQAPANQVALLTSIYNTFNNSPFRPAAASVHADPNDVSAVSYFTKSAAFLSEWLLMGRLDYHIGNKDNFFVHYKQDHGIQPTYTDLISPLFTDSSPQPAWEGQMSETHTFTDNFVNQLVLTGNYYSAPFQNANNYRPVAPFTFSWIDGDLGNNTYGGIDYAFPQGRRVAGYQIIDDASYSKGRNTIHFGYNFRRDNITDLQGARTSAAATLDEGSVEAFGNGQTGYVHSQYFPTRLEQPVAVYNMGAYVEDSFKLMPNLTVTAGLRVERNSNPTCLANCLQTLAYPVAGLPTGTASTTVAYNAAVANGLIIAGRHRAFRGYQKYAPEPRVSFAYQPFGTGGKTVIRGGFGMFTDTFPGLIADTLLSNAPGNFHAAVYGSDIGNPNEALDPTTAGSGASIAIASNAAFQTAFKTGGNYTTTKNAVAAAGATYSAPNFATTAPSIKYPTYEEFSLAIEQKIDQKSSVAITYVGNHGYHEPVANGGTNLTSTGSTKYAGFFPTVPTVKPVTPFTTITNYYSGASSNYNGVVISAQRRAKNLTMQFNYQFSKALDEVSNGGLEPYAPDNGDAESTANPNNLHAQYGPADYNVKHNTTGSFVYTLPSFIKTGMMKNLTGGFEFSGAVFHQTGLPYTILQSTSNIGVVNAAGTQVGTSSFSAGTVNLFARKLNNNFDHHCGGGIHALLPDGTNPHPCNFTASFGAPSTFTQQGRNDVTGPSYTNVDFGAFKVISIPYAEFMKLKLGAQFFNFFNHPNFQNPGHTLTGTPSSSYGAISTTVSSPTNIFGSVGANSSPRLIQLKASLTF
jgi:hypothetical protein